MAVNMTTTILIGTDYQDYQQYNSVGQVQVQGKASIISLNGLDLMNVRDKTCMQPYSIEQNFLSVINE